MQTDNLTEAHIEYIIEDLTYRGIIFEGIRSEIIDHVCSATSAEMENGMRFIEAYHKTLRSFGNTAGMREVQRQAAYTFSHNPTLMLRNHVTIAWRSLCKQPVYSTINVLGLAISLAACLIISLFIIDEISYDNYNVNADRIFRVNAEVKFGGNHFMMTYRSAPEASTMMQNFPEIEATVRFIDFSPYFVKTADNAQSLKENKVIWADSTFFRIFTVKVLEGNPNNALAEPGGIAISQRTARKYFGNSSPLGKSLILDNNYHGKVTAVYQDFPSASHFHFDIVVSLMGDWPPARHARSTNFATEDFTTYILLKPGVDAKKLEAKFPKFVDTYLGAELTKGLGPNFSMAKFRSIGNFYNLSLMPLRDIHLHSNIMGEFEPNGNIIYVYLLSAAALFILVIACVNFMNLSTARSGSRAKEVGIRKVMGSLRSILIQQFLSEAFIVTGCAVLISVGIAYLFLPAFNILSQKELRLPVGEPMLYVSLFLITALVTVMAGFYPAFLLSAFKPVNVLKGQHASLRGTLVRSVLVVFQFTVSIIFIIGALVVNRQLHFIQTKRLGFNKDQVIVIHDTYALRPANVIPFKNEAMKIAGIERGTVSGYVPVAGGRRNNDSFWPAGSDAAVDNMISSQRWIIDFDYIETMGMELVAGRNFSPDFPSDSTAVILNEEAVTRLGFSDPIGQKISRYKGNNIDAADVGQWTIIGVVKNFHFASMKNEIAPLAFYLGSSDGSVSFRFAPSQGAQIIESMEKVWKHLAPGDPFQYSFLNKDYENMYVYEQRLGRIFNIVAMIAVIIACLGLFALTAFAAHQRTREIGIRKVLGANVNSIFFLLSKEFGKLIVIAFALSVPIAWKAVDWWLSSYTYKATVGFGIYGLAGLMTLAVALITMSYQVLKAALANPSDSLRND